MDCWENRWQRREISRLAARHKRENPDFAFFANFFPSAGFHGAQPRMAAGRNYPEIRFYQAPTGGPRLLLQGDVVAADLLWRQGPPVERQLVDGTDPLPLLARWTGLKAADPGAQPRGVEDQRHFFPLTVRR